MALLHHQVTSRPHPALEQRGVYKPRRIPPEYERQQASASTEGGRGVCYVCKRMFSMTYMRLVYIGTFRAQEHVCKECQRKHKFVVV